MRLPARHFRPLIFRFLQESLGLGKNGINGVFTGVRQGAHCKDESGDGFHFLKI